MPYFTPSVPDTTNDFGLALDAGRLVGTIIGSDGHITVRAWCKRKSDSGRWVTCKFADAYLVDLSVPGAEGDWADKIATWYPAHSSSKWAGRFFADRAQSDDRRVRAAEYLLDVAAGIKSGAHVELAKRCLRCGKELTHPDSITTNFGPDCAKELGIANRSGTDDAPHLPKAKPTQAEVIARDTAHADEERDEFLRNASDDELDEYMKRFDGRDDEVANKARMAGANERTRRNVARDFTPPKVDLNRAPVDNTPKREIDVDETIVARLRAGDDPKAILAALDAR